MDNNSKIKPVFCAACLFLTHTKKHKPCGVECTYQCGHRKNVYYKKSYLEKTRAFHKLPEEINKNNDCGWFRKDFIAVFTKWLFG